MIVLDLDGTLDIDDLPPELVESSDTGGPPSAATGPMSLVGHPMDDWERFAIEQTLKLTNDNREEAARILEIGARTLYRKLEKYNL